MSKSPQPMTTLPSPGRRLPGAGTFIGFAIMLLAVGGGVYYFANLPQQQASEDDQDDELAFVEDQLATGQPQRLASATITDVVTAGHQESEFDNSEPTILQVGYPAGARPSSNPSIWLVGTIEPAAELEPSNRSAWQDETLSR